MLIILYGFEYPRSVLYLRIAGAADYIESLDIHMSEASPVRLLLGSLEQGSSRLEQDYRSAG